MSEIKKCNFCGKDIFWLENSEGKWQPFEADVIKIEREGIYFADDKDRIGKSTNMDIGKKGFLYHSRYKCGSRINQ